MISHTKKLTAFLILASFLSVAFLGLIMMVHGVDGSISGDCPFDAGESALCPLNLLDNVTHHISTYRNFFSTPIGYGILAFIISLTSLIYVYSSVFVSSQITSTSRSLENYHFNFLSGQSLYNKTTTNWLSLLEHSPAE